MSRAFERPSLSVTCSDRTERLKQKTIYKGLENQSTARNLYPNAKSAQWAKKGSINYTFTQGGTQNTQGTATPANSAGCLKAAHSYELLLDAAKGKCLTNPALAGSIVGFIPNWISPFIEKESGKSHTISRTALNDDYTSIDICGNGIPNPIPTEPNYTGDDSAWNPTNYPGYIIGNDTIAEPCNSNNNFIDVDDSSFKVNYKWSSEYWKLAQLDKMYSLKYPKSISLQQQPTDLSKVSTQRLAPQPSINVDNDPQAQLSKYCEYYRGDQ